MTASHLRDTADIPCTLWALLQARLAATAAADMAGAVTMALSSRDAAGLVSKWLGAPASACCRLVFGSPVAAARTASLAGQWSVLCVERDCGRCFVSTTWVNMHGDFA